MEELAGKEGITGEVARAGGHEVLEQEDEEGAHVFARALLESDFQLARPVERLVAWWAHHPKRRLAVSCWRIE